MHSKMSSRERILAAMKQEDVDRIPLSPRISLNVLPRYYRTHDVLAHKKFKRDYFDYDPVYIPGFPAENPFYKAFANPFSLNDVDVLLDFKDNGDHFLVAREFTTPAGKVSDKMLVPKPDAKVYGSSPNPHKLEHMIKSPEDLEKIQYMFPSLENCDFTKFHDAVHEMGEDGLVLMNVPGPMDYLGGEAYPMEQMMIDYYERPEFFDAILNLFATYSINMVKTALENDVLNFFLVYFYPSLSTGWSPQIIEEKFAPIIKRQVDMIHSAGGLADYYDDGKLMKSMDIFIRAGVDVIETCSPPPAGDFCLKDARDQLGYSVTFKGLVDIINVVWRGSPADIDRHIHEIIEQNRGKRALILGTMDNIRPETSDENIEAYFRSANKYR